MATTLPLTYIKLYIKTVTMRHEYTLFKRYKDPKNKKRIVWFFYYYDEEGKRIPKSTGKSLKHEAVTIVEKFLAQDDTKDRKLKEYSKTFFVWDECLWIRRQHAKGKRSSKTNATLRRDHLQVSRTSLNDTVSSSLSPVVMTL